MNKILTLVAVLVMLSASTTLAQDCDKYHDLYRVCIEKSDAGRELDYHNVCKKSPCKDSMIDCILCGCNWRASKNACMTDICISENSGDGMVSAPDYAALKKEYLRTGCPFSP